MVRSRSYIATPPGATIKEQLNDRGMSQKEFAARMDMSEKHISKLINGEVQLTPETAVRLEMVLGVPAKFWNNLEAIYREKIIKAEAENAMDADAEMAKQFPYSEMAKFGWVPETREAKEKVVNLRKYFEVVELSLLGNEQITRIACRRLVLIRLLFTPTPITPLIGVEPVQLWGQSICPIAAGDFKWAYAVTFTGYL